MAISFIASSLLGSGTGARNIDKPTGTTEFDLMLLGIAAHAAPSVPGDWTPVDSETGSYGIYIYRKLAGAAEGSNYALNAAGAASYTACILTLRTNSAGMELQVDASDTQDNASSTNRVFPSVIATVTNTFLACIGSFQTNFASSPDGAMTERIDGGSNPRIYAMTQSVASAGATGTRTATGAGATASKTASVLVKEAAAGSAPDAPSGLIATTFDDDRIDLAWTDNSDDEDNFVLERSPNGSDTWTEVATPAAGAVGASNTGLTPNTIYYYRIKAVNAFGSSSYSNVASATTDLAPLVAPTGLTVTATDQQELTLEWDESGNSDFDGIAIERSPDGTTNWAEIDTVADGVETYVDTGLQAGTEYFYRVRPYRD